MQITDSDYYRDAVAMAAVDRISHVQLFDCILMGRTGQAFNAAVWATIRLNEISSRSNENIRDEKRPSPG